MNDISFKIIMSVDKDMYMQEIWRKTNISLSSILRNIHELEELNLIETKKEGRIRFIKLTEKGVKFRDCIKKMMVLINETE